MSNAISAELRGTGVSITTLCPGATETKFAAKAGLENSLLFKLFVMQPDRVAEIGYHAVMKGKVSVIAGIYNKILVYSSNLLPKRVVNFLSKKMLMK